MTSQIELARLMVAEKHVQPYQINAIMRGDWDTGSLVKNALAEVEAYQTAHPEAVDNVPSNL